MKTVRRVIALLATAGAVLIAAGCGGEDEGEEEVGGAPAPATQAFPVTIEHKFGSTETPGPAERIVVVGFNDGDFALALGKVPVGARAPVADYPFLELRVGAGGHRRRGDRGRRRR